MEADSWKIAHELLASGCVSLFEGLGVEIIIVTDGLLAPMRKGERVATFVGYSGNELRGSITMDFPISLVSRLHPSAASAAAIANEDLCDWAGELANQLLGRLKSGLTRHGVTLQVSTPSTVWGEMTHATNMRVEGSTELHFAAGEDLILVYFDGLSLVPLDLTATPVEDLKESPSEGDMMMLL